MFGITPALEVREMVGRFAAGFDPALVSAGDAERIVEALAAVENMVATVRGLAAKRVAETEVWRRSGERSAAHHLARLSGTSLGRARATLATAEQLDDLPALADAARRGVVSLDQAAPIAEAATAAPGAEGRLLEAARTSSLPELRDACARTKAAALPDDAARHAAVHRARFLRRRRCPDGGGELTYHSTLEEVAELFAMASSWAERRFMAARASGVHEPAEAYLADGLLDAARAGCQPQAAPAASAPEPIVPPGSEASAGPEPTGGDDPAAPSLFAPVPAGGVRWDPDVDYAAMLTARLAEFAARRASPAAGPPARPAQPPPPAPPRLQKVIVRIDWDALVRGYPCEGEVCEIAGLGPVPVAAVRQMIDSGHAFLAAVVTKGVDVATVAHLGRHPSAFQRTALEFRSSRCAVEGCSAELGLEYDHVETGASTRFTLASLLERVCTHHHDLKSHQGWDFVAGTGKRPMVAPDDPRPTGSGR